MRFGAIEALAGATAGTASLSGSKPGSGREETVSRQRRGRAWRLLVAQAGMQVAVPGAAPAPSKDGKEPQAPAPVPTMKLIDLVGRLLLAALRKGRSAARFCVAAGAVASLAGAHSGLGARELAGRVLAAFPCPRLHAPSSASHPACCRTRHRLHTHTHTTPCRVGAGQPDGGLHTARHLPRRRPSAGGAGC